MTTNHSWVLTQGCRKVTKFGDASNNWGGGGEICPLDGIGFTDNFENYIYSKALCLVYTSWNRILHLPKIWKIRVNSMWTVNFLTQFKIKYVLLQAHISPDHAALKPRQIEKGLTFNQLPASKKIKKWCISSSVWVFLHSGQKCCPDWPVYE